MNNKKCAVIENRNGNRTLPAPVRTGDVGRRGGPGLGLPPTIQMATAIPTTKGWVLASGCVHACVRQAVTYSGVPYGCYDAFQNGVPVLS